jgi:DHA1 family bicyclomycin/chloramphenicol resistance-like MFS transporter
MSLDESENPYRVESVESASPDHGHRLLVVVLSVLSMLGAFSIDAYLPAFLNIEQNLGITRDQVQFTLSIYLLTFAFMMLFHGTLSDSFGRRPVILWSITGYALGSTAAVFAPNLWWLLAARALQGLSAGAGSVVGRAIIRDLYPGNAGQKMMAHVMMVFSLAPAIAPVVGGWLLKFYGWRAIFVFLSIVSFTTLAVCFRVLKESLPQESRVPLHLGSLLRRYWQVGSHGVFLLQAVGLGMGFAGFSLYISTAPDFLIHVLHLKETDFAWLFIPIIVGMMSGSWLSARMAETVAPARQIRLAYMIMGSAAAANFIYLSLCQPSVPWALLPGGVYMFGLAMGSPAMTLQVLDLFPAVRGLCASLQGFIQMLLFALMSAIAAPIVVKDIPHLPIKLGTAVLVGWALSLGFWWAGSRSAARDAARAEADLGAAS